MACLVGVAAYLYPYLSLFGYWWRSIPAAAAILLAGVLVYGKDAFEFFGLKIPPKQLALSVALCAVLTPAFAYLIFNLIVVEPLRAQRFPYSLSQVHQFFQVFNDEVVVRAAMLTLLLRFFPYPKIVIVSWAMIFSAGHFILYRYGGETIDLTASVAIFSFGAIANLLFVKYGHIGYSFALHYAWNMERFNTIFYRGSYELGEGTSFNYIEGTPWFAAGSLAVFIVMLIWFARTTPQEASP